MASSADASRMGETLPPDFITLDAASKNVDLVVNIMGVICDYLSPSRSRGIDFQVTFTLLDPSIRSSSIIPNGMKVKFFRSVEAELPKIQGKGDIMLLRNVKISKRYEQIIALSNWRTTWVLIPESSIPAAQFRNAYATREKVLPHVGLPGSMRAKQYEQEHQISIHEQQWAITLHSRFPEFNSYEHSRKARTTSTSLGPAAARGEEKANPAFPHVGNTTADDGTSGFAHNISEPQRNNTRVPVAPRHDKYSLLKDVELNKFYDLAAQVVKKFSSDFGLVELYISDYTSNKSFRSYEKDSNSDWQGPYGTMTLRVEVMPPHTSWVAHNVKEGDYVFLRNVRVKLSKSSEIEGNLWHDSLYRDRINVSILPKSDSRIAALISRRESYEAGLQRKDKPSGNSRNRRNKARANKTWQLDQSITSGAQTIVDKSNTTTAKRQENVKLIASKAFEPNPHIKAIKPDRDSVAIPLSEIMNVDRSFKTLKGNKYELPFLNFLAFTTVRVIDYYPHDLRDFSVLKSRSLSAENYKGTMGADEMADSQWEWSFMLLLEDAMTTTRQGDSAPVTPTRLPVIVCGKDGDFLLNLSATDLRVSSGAFSQLKERLFLLWGDLEEQKSSALSNHHSNINETASESLFSAIKPNGRPFTCCIGEFGVPSTPLEDNSGFPSEVDSQLVYGSNMGWERCHRLCKTLRKCGWLKMPPRPRNA